MEMGLSTYYRYRKKVEDMKLERMQFVILLISADFMASDFITSDELPPILRNAQNRGTTILPLIVSASYFSSDKNLGQYHSANDPSKPLNQLSKALHEKTLHDISLTIRSYFTQSK